MASMEARSLRADLTIESRHLSSTSSISDTQVPRSSYDVRRWSEQETCLPPASAADSGQPPGEPQDELIAMATNPALCSAQRRFSGKCRHVRAYGAG